MRIVLLIICTTCVLGASVTLSQEKDPFFPGGERSAVTASLPQENAWGRDPFTKPFEGKALSSTPTGSAGKGGLTGIIYGKHAHIAIIDGEAYKEGSHIEGRKLVQIRKRSVVFMSSSGSVEEVFLQDFSIRK